MGIALFSQRVCHFLNQFWKWGYSFFSRLLCYIILLIFLLLADTRMVQECLWNACNKYEVTCKVCTKDYVDRVQIWRGISSYYYLQIEVNQLSSDMVINKQYINKFNLPCIYIPLLASQAFSRFVRFFFLVPNL